MKKAALSLLLALFLCLAGCDGNVFESLSDDSSDVADLETARMAIDDGNYQEAIDLLLPGYDETNPDPDVSRVLASAYMGLAGVDLTYLIENSEDSDSENFDIIASALSVELIGEGSTLFIAYSSGEDMLENLGYSQSSLDNLMDGLEAAGLTPEQDDVVQQGMASAIHFIVQIGLLAGDVMAGNIPITTDAYRQTFPNDTDLDACLTDLAAAIGGSSSDMSSSLQADLQNVSDAVDVLAEVMEADDDISVEFSQFLTELLGGGSITDFSGTSVSSYVRTELLGY